MKWFSVQYIPFEKKRKQIQVTIQIQVFKCFFNCKIMRATSVIDSLALNTGCLDKLSENKYVLTKI